MQSARFLRPSGRWLAALSLFGGCLLLPVHPAAARQRELAAPCVPAPAMARQQAADFLHLWQTLRADYAYWAQKHIDWLAVRHHFLPKAEAACTEEAFIAVLEQTLETLCDSHAHLGTNLASSTRLVPSGLDVWAEWRAGKAIVTAVRAGFPADQAGLRPGMEILAMAGVPVAEAVSQRLPFGLRSEDPAGRQWALLALLAGRHDTPRHLTVRSGDETRDIHPDAFARPQLARVSSRRLEGNIGYIQVNDVGANETVAEFNAALDALMDARALILDLRDTAAGGSTDVAEPILGRFITHSTAYQRIIPRRRAPWTRSVAPRAPYYGKPLYVLVGRWTGSMGEGMAIGLDGMRRAMVVGTRMAGLRGAVTTRGLRHHRFSFTFPFEQLRHVDGTPREGFVPPVLVDLLAEPGSTTDPVLAEALRRIAAMTAPSPTPAAGTPPG